MPRQDVSSAASVDGLKQGKAGVLRVPQSSQHVRVHDDLRPRRPRSAARSVNPRWNRIIPDGWRRVSWSTSSLSASFGNDVNPLSGSQCRILCLQLPVLKLSASGRVQRSLSQGPIVRCAQRAYRLQESTGPSHNRVDDLPRRSG
jgi:hypothetical protein